MSPTSTGMSFVEMEHGSAMLEKLRSQREEGRFCDVTLYVEGKTFRAHRSVLASCSPYFDSILKMHRVVKERLTVTCKSSEVFQCLINYMYTGNVVIDKDNVQEILRLANHFLVSKLKFYCEEFLTKNLELSNWLSTRDLAEKYNMTDLSKHAVLFLHSHAHDLVKQEEFLKLSTTQIQDLLCEKNLGLPSEVLLNLACSWTQRDPSRELHFPSLLELAADWSTLSDEMICSHLDNQPLYATSSDCLLGVLRHLVQATRLPQQYQSTFQALSCKMGTQEMISTVAPLEQLEQHPTVLTSVPPMNDSNGKETTSSTQEQDSRSKLPGRQNSEERSKHRRKASAVSHLWRSPAARLTALRRMQGRMQALQTLGRSVLEEAPEEEKEPAAREGDPEEEGVVENGALSCELCQFSTADAAELENHCVSCHGNTTPLRYKCGICGFTCSLSKQYYTHMKQQHFPGPPFTCDSCDFTCERIHLVLSHRMRHTDLRPFSCLQCGFRCRTRPNLLQHQRCHTGHRPFTCEACGRSFGMKSTLEQHLATHSSDRPYLCDTCGFSTKYLSHLIAHKRIHSGEVHRCSYPHCRYSTPKKSQLDSHMRTHMGVRPHSCTTCGRGFLEKSHLVRHERIHLEVKPFKCDACNYASSRRDKLKEHFNRHHGQNASAKVPYRPRPPKRAGQTGKFEDLELLMPQMPQQPVAGSSSNYNAFEQIQQEFSGGAGGGAVASKPPEESVMMMQTRHSQATSMSQVAMMFGGNIQQVYNEHQASAAVAHRSMNAMTIPNQHAGNIDYSTLQPCMSLF